MKKTRLPNMVLDLTIVVAGVLLALAADSAIERSRERRSEDDAIQALAHDIGRDLQQLDQFWAPRLQAQEEARQRLMSFQEDDLPIAEPLAFVSDIVLVSQYWTFDPHTGAMEDLLATRGLSLIKNPELRRGLVSYRASVRNLAEFDTIHRAYFLEVSGRIHPQIVAGFAVSRTFRADNELGDPELARQSAADALDEARIRESGLLREMLEITAIPFEVKRSGYAGLRDSARNLLDLLEASL